MFQKSCDPAQTIILAGSGRSGTTWLGNIIAANPNMRIIFEPFDYRRVSRANCLPLFAYARPRERYPEWEAYLADVLCGRVENEWINRQGRRWWATRRFVKAIRINSMLGWIDDTFHPKIVFTARHPCAVILSRMKLEWETHLDVFLEQPQLVADYLQPYMDLITGAKTEIEKRAVMWCLENLVALRQLPQRNWIVCTYEQLYAAPETEAARVLAGLGLRKTWLTRRAIHRVSMVTRPDSSLVAGRNPVTEWQHAMSEDQIRTVLDTVAAFGITLYGADAMPNLS